MSQEHKTQKIKKAAYIAILINGLLGGLKTVGGFLFQSHALLADGLHSLSDLIIDFMVIIGGHWSHQAADAEHPYGHQRIETALTLFISIFLVFTGFFIALDAFRGMLHPFPQQPTPMALVLALISAIANEILFRYTMHLNKGIDTELLKACAWHHRSDAFTAIVVVVGIVLSILGFHRLDHIAAIIVGLIIIKMGWDYTFDSLQQLIDKGVDLQTHENISDSINRTPGVEKIHQLRTRLMGQDIYVDVHVLVDPFISVSAGHFIAQDVHHRLMKNIPNMRDVVVHIDPEDDEDHNPNHDLPDTEKISQKLIKIWRKQHPEIADWNLHYLNQEIQLDLIIKGKIKDFEHFKVTILQDCQRFHAAIKSIRVLSELETIAILSPN
jgi:cation diffusion facilitator family transporter